MDDGNEQAGAPAFDEIGSITIRAGLDPDGDQVWGSSHAGLNPMEVIGLLTVVRQRMINRMSSVSPQED